jgi:hypothetical protein
MTRSGRFHQWFSLLLVLSSLVVLSACRKHADPVRSALDAVVAAAEKRDAGAILKRISADYRDSQDNGRAELEGTVRRYLFAYDTLSVALADVKIERSANEALASFRADLSGTPTKVGGLDAWFPRSSAWRFEVRLVEEKGEWRFVWASWTRLD